MSRDERRDGHGDGHPGDVRPRPGVSRFRPWGDDPAAPRRDGGGMSPARRTAASYRPDIEGLRAVAIGVVLLAHAGVGFARGGYVGVDVFFVISGFLITLLLVTELDRTGRLSLARFYARRMKRLMPQVLVVSAAVVLASWLLLSPVRADAVAEDVIASGVYAMNWR